MAWRLTRCFQSSVVALLYTMRRRLATLSFAVYQLGRQLGIVILCPIIRAN